MKKILIVLLCLVTVLCCVSCGGKKEPDADTSKTADTQKPADTQKSADTQKPAETAKPANTSSDAIDVDLTKMNSTMVYSEVSNMLSEPEKYIGKTVRMKGQFNASYFEGTGNYYYYVVIADATACCAQGIEFVWEGEHNYPDDFPKNGDEVIVTGVFGQYDELGITYNYVSTDGITLA
ncbi:MAG: hypothetical protein IJR90_01660 [Clostridia bacterium]|nr:hypothetical protein [Clostridia bacterium]